MSEERHIAFANAYYRQASSDWQVYRTLEAGKLPRCHALHYLQMACEKLAKAYRLRDTSSKEAKIRKSHTGFAKFINAFLRSPALMAEYQGQLARHQAVCKSAARFAEAIEKLAPSIDQETSPENAEYPWERGRSVITPCEYDYPALSLLSAAGGRAFLNLIDRALRDYAQIKIH